MPVCPESPGRHSTEGWLGPHLDPRNPNWAGPGRHAVEILQRRFKCRSRPGVSHQGQRPVRAGAQESGRGGCALRAPGWLLGAPRLRLLVPTARWDPQTVTRPDFPGKAATSSSASRSGLRRGRALACPSPVAPSGMTKPSARSPLFHCK